MKIGDKLIAIDLCIMDGNEELINPQVQSASFTIGKIYEIVDRKNIYIECFDIHFDDMKIISGPVIVIIDDKGAEHLFIDDDDISNPYHWNGIFKVGKLDETLN